MGNLLNNIWNKFAMFKQDVRIMMVGLDAAGKTTVLYKLKLGEVVTPIPTIGFNVEEVTYKNLTFNVWDIGGQTQIRNMWRYYYQGTNAVIFVVDSSDPERFNTAKEELFNLYHAEELADASFLIFANKQDIPGSKSVPEITEALGLTDIKNKNWFIQATCARTGDGLYEGLDWLSKNIKTSSSA